MTLHAVAANQGPADWRNGCDATLQHLGLLKRKQDRLREAQIEAEHQLLHSASAAYRNGDMTIVQLAAIYHEYAAVATSGFMRRWDFVMPITAKRVPHLDRNEPNGPNGSWSGTYPIGVAPAPPKGTCVVYVLFDAAGEPCYIGSSQSLRERLRNHRISIDFERWVAYPCADREAAYVLETELLREHKPYRNKKRGR